jgi:hypothetical protein
MQWRKERGRGEGDDRHAATARDRQTDTHTHTHTTHGLLERLCDAVAKGEGLEVKVMAGMLPRPSMTVGVWYVTSSRTDGFLLRAELETKEAISREEEEEEEEKKRERQTEREKRK